MREERRDDRRRCDARRGKYCLLEERDVKTVKKHEAIGNKNAVVFDSFMF